MRILLINLLIMIGLPYTSVAGTEVIRMTAGKDMSALVNAEYHYTGPGGGYSNSEAHRVEKRSPKVLSAIGKLWSKIGKIWSSSGPILKTGGKLWKKLGKVNPLFPVFPPGGR